MKLSEQFIAACIMSIALAAGAFAQEVPLSGANGSDFVYATSPGGESQLFQITLASLGAPVPIGAPIPTVPSRWAHRRRTLGALETSITFVQEGLVLTPVGAAVGGGGIHLVDARGGVITTALAMEGNPPGYDAAVAEPLQFAFAASDDGAGNTILRGYSYANIGALIPTSPASLALGGPPSAYVSRMLYDYATNTLHVPAASGIYVIQLQAVPPHMSILTFIPAAPASPATNPIALVRGGVTEWAIGTSKFSAEGAPVEAGFMTWNLFGLTGSGFFGFVPSAPSKNWVPAAGTHELAVVSNQDDAYVYYLLREPAPATFFVKGAGIGAVAFVKNTAPLIGVVALSDAAGEPFSILTVSGTRVAFETSFGPPFVYEPPDGGERICILYSPLDPLGASSAFGVAGVPAPLGGRISTKGMDRPIWSFDGGRVAGATSHFPGAPHPMVPGLEVLALDDNIKVNSYNSPHAAVPNLTFPNQSILLTSVFVPRDPTLAGALGDLTVIGGAFHDGMYALALTGFSELGQKQVEPAPLTQSPAIPNFPSILPPSFDDASGSLVSIPASFGARRTTFNYIPGAGLYGIIQTCAAGGEALVQPAGYNIMSIFGFVPPLPPFRIPLPSGWITTSEFFSY